MRNAAKTVMESTGSMNFRVNFRTIPAGLRMVSVPYRLAANSNTPADVFGAGNVARWCGALGDYRYYPEHPEGGFSPGPDDPRTRRGWWAPLRPAWPTGSSCRPTPRCA